MPDDLLHPISERRRAGAEPVVLRLDGDLDLDSTPAAWTRLRAAADGGCHELVVDLTAVRFCDVSGVNVLLRASTLLAARGATLRLRGVDERLHTLVATLGVADLLPAE